MRVPRPLPVLVVLGQCAAFASAQGAQSAPNSPGIKLVAFAHSFFKTHRTGVLRQWFETYRDPNSGLIGEWHTEIHLGYRFEFIRGERYKRDELGILAITDPSVQLPQGISIGDSKDKITKQFGTPDQTGGDTVEYELSHEMSFLTFRFTRGRLIEFEVSIDHD